MSQHPSSFTPETLLERVLRVAELLTLPAPPADSAKPDGTQTDFIISTDEVEAFDRTKTVKRRFQVK